MIFDDNSGKMVLEFTFPDPVLAVRMKKDKLIAVCRTQIHVFSFPNKIGYIRTCGAQVILV